MTALKQVYRDGITFSPAQDSITVIPLPVDVMRYQQSADGENPTDFAWWDTSNSPGPNHSGFMHFRGNINYVTTTGSSPNQTVTVRTEHASTNSLLTEAEETWWSISIYTTIGYVNDPLYELITQWHSIGGSPPVAISRENGRIRFQIWTGSGFVNQQVFDVGPIPAQGNWAHFVCRIKWADDLSGRMTVWRNGRLARLHDPEGNPWVVPESQSGVGTNWLIKPSLGDIPYTSIESGQEASVLDWYGRISRIGDGITIDKYPKHGIYKSSLTNRFNPDGSLKEGWNVEGNPLYIPIPSRETHVGIGNVNYETRVNELTHNDIFKSLDINGNPPLETPEWWVTPEPINITYPETGRSFERGSVVNIETDVTEGEVELIVNNNSVETKSISPYVFQIQDIPINNAVVDLPFDGNLNEWSNLENSITLINPSDASYVEGVRGQAISLGNDSIIANKSYISITPSNRLKSISNRFTISFWIKGEPIFHRLFANNGEGKGLYFQTLSGGRIDFFIQNSGPNGESYQLRSSSIGGNGFIESDTWHHYAWIYDGSYLRCFYDLIQSNELLIEDDIDFSTESNWLINRKYDSDQPGTVSFDDFRIYDYAFTAENIQDLVEDKYLGTLDVKVRRGGIESDPITINIVESTEGYEGPYYISNDGDNSNEGSLSEPIATVSKLNDILSEGINNSVNFNRGDSFEDGVEIPTTVDGTAQNPIEFKPYGSGDKPTLSGFKEIDNFSLVSGNIYEAQNIDFPDYIYKLMIGNIPQPKGRLPKTDWLRADSTTSSSMTSTNFPSIDYSGGEVEAVMWKMQWVIDTVKVTGLVGDQMNYTGGSSYPPSARTDGRYFIQNAVECLTEDGDWMYDTNTKTLTIFSTVNPNTLSVMYSSEGDGIEGIGNTFNHYQDLSLDGSINGLDLEGSDSNQVSGLNIKDQSGDGVAVRNSHNVVVENTDITDVDVRGISFTNTSQSPTVTGNKVTNIALKVGNPIANGDEKGNGIYFSNSEDIDCQLNEVTNIGFNGIRYNDNNALISRNLVEDFCKTKHDGSGIYTYGGGSGVNTHTGRVVSNNVVRIGGDALRPNVYGIYIDDNSENISHSGNLIKDIWNAGYYIHNSHDLSFNGDIIYGCGTLFKFGQDGSNELIRSNVITDMVFALTSKSDFGFEILSNSNDISSFFSINNNTYIVASNNQLVFTTRWVEGAKTFFNNVDFEGWQALGNDVGSNIRYLNVPEYTILSEGSNKWDGTVGNYHQGGEVTVNVDGSDVEVLMSIQSGTTTRAEIHFRLDNVESDKDYIVRFRARALSGHQSLNLYMRQSNAPYRDLGGKTAAVVGSEWKDFEFLVTDLIAENLAGYLIDCQSNQGTLEISDFEFVEAVVDKTNYEDYILPISNISPNSDIIEVGSGWRSLNGEEVSQVNLDSFESVVLLNDDLPVQEYEVTVTQTSGGNVTGGGTYEEGEEVTLTATPDSGFVFIRWSNDETNNPYTFVASGDVSISAVFEEAGTEGPLSEIISPENNSVFTEGDPIEIEVNVTQGSNPIDRVELYVGGNLLSTIESPPYEYTWEDASPGVYNLTARVIDSEDIVGKSDPVLITVQDGPDPEPGYFTVNIKFNVV